MVHGLVLGRPAMVWRMQTNDPPAVPVTDADDVSPADDTGAIEIEPGRARRRRARDGWVGDLARPTPRRKFASDPRIHSVSYELVGRGLVLDVDPDDTSG